MCDPQLGGLDIIVDLGHDTSILYLDGYIVLYPMGVPNFRVLIRASTMP